MMSAHEPSLSVFAFMQSQPPALLSMNVRPTEVITTDGAVVHAIDGNGHPTLLVPVPSDTDTNLDWENRSVAFGYRTIRLDDGQKSFLALQCKSERLLPQFALLVDDILESIAEDIENANMVTRRVVERWREMLMDSKQPLLGETQLSGLFGELVFLEELVAHHGPSALLAWTGPLGNRHDFEFTNASFEVKTTTNHNNMVVAFHGARQLEVSPGNSLCVVAHQVERVPVGVSVPNIINRLIAMGIDRFELLRKLAENGYHEIDSNHYLTVTFAILASKKFLVDSNFPRITHETLTHGDFLEKISGLQYSVDLGHLKDIDLDYQALQLESL